MAGRGDAGRRTDKPLKKINPIIGADRQAAPLFLLSPRSLLSSTALARATAVPR